MQRARDIISTGEGRDLKAKLSRVFYTMRLNLLGTRGVDVRNQRETMARTFGRSDRFER
jgi:hypothetical protein